MSKIEWTEKTWNPVVGCEIESPGCKNCYAMEMAGRLEAMTAKTGTADHYLGTTKKVTSGSGQSKTVWTGKIGMAPNAVWEAPLRRKKPTRYFVNSMGDLFHPNVPDDAIDRAFAVMALSPQHIFQVLTKHPKRMRDWMKAHSDETWMDLSALDFFWKASQWPYFADDGDNYSELDHQLSIADGETLCSQPFPWPNVWLGVSVEDQARADARIPALLGTPAAVRFISAEPLLGPVDLTAIQSAGIFEINALNGAHGVTRPLGGYGPSLDWVIVGGESGKAARPMHPLWVRSLRDQCAAAGVPFFFKQWGAWAELEAFDPTGDSEYYDENKTYHPDGRFVSGVLGVHGRLHKDAEDADPPRVRVLRVGKSRAGRTLDGKIHDDFPIKAGAES